MVTHKLSIQMLVKPTFTPGSGFIAFQDGQEIPGYMLNTEWKDSFADVETKGVWENGK